VGDISPTAQGNHYAFLIFPGT